MYLKHRKKDGEEVVHELTNPVYHLFITLITFHLKYNYKINIIYIQKNLWFVSLNTTAYQKTFKILEKPMLQPKILSVLKCESFLYCSMSQLEDIFFVVRLYTLIKSAKLSSMNIKLKEIIIFRNYTDLS